MASSKPFEVDKKAILDSIDEHVVYQDRKHRIVWVNKSAADSVGKKPEELKGKLCYQVWNRLKEPCKDCPVEKAIRTGRAHKAEISTPDKRFWSISGYPIKEKGKIVGAIETTKEITKERKASIALKESEESYQTIFDKANDAIFIHEMETGKVLDVNSTMLRMYGFRSKKELIVLFVVSVISRDCHYSVLVARAFIEKAIKGRPQVFEWHARKRSGDLFWVEVKLKKVRLGEKDRILAVVRDITERKASNQALKKSEERLRGLFESSPEVIVILDRKARITDVNNKAKEWLGYSKKEVVGKSVISLPFLSGKEKARVMANFSKRILGQEIEPYDVEFSKKNGEKAVGRITASPMLDKKGKTTGTIAMISNVTGARKAEEEKKREQEKFRIIATSTNDILYEWDIASRRMQWFGESSRIFGNSVPKSIDEFKRLLHPDDTRAVEDASKNGIQKGETWSGEYRLLLNGKRVRHLFGSGTAVYEDGKPVRVYGAITDITKQKESKRQLKESEERLRNILGNINDALYIHDMKGRLIEVNENSCRMLGYGRDELVGSTLSKIDSKTSAKRAKQKIREIAERGSLVFEAEHRKKDGTRLPVSISSRLIKWNGRKAIQSFVRDISDLKSAEEKYRFLVDNTKELILIIDGKGKVLFANNAVIKTFGYSKEEIVGESVTKFLTGDSVKKAMKSMTLDFMGRKQPSMELEAMTAKGEKRVIRTEEGSEFTEIEGKKGILVNFSDITEKKKAQDELRESERKYRMIADNTDDMIAIAEASRKVPYIYVSPSFERVLGYKPEEMIGKSAMEGLHPDDMKKMAPLVRRYLSTKAMGLFSGKPAKATEKLEYRYRDRSGKWRHLSSTANLLGDRILFVTKDITKEREAERKYRAIADHTSDLISILTFGLNPKYEYNSPSHKRIMGYEPGELYGKRGLDYVHPDDRGKLFSLLKGYVTEKARMKLGMSKKPWHETFAYRVKKKSGGWIHLETTADLVENRILMVSRDVTQQKRAQQEIVKAKQEYEEIYRNLPLIAFTLDRKGKVIDANREAERFTGMKLSDNLGRGFSDVASLDRRDLLKAWREFRKNLHGKVTRRTEYKVKLNGGRKRVIQLVGIPLFEEGKVTKVLIAGSDITEEKRARDEIRQSGERLFQVLQGSGVPTFVIDRKHRVRYWNRACESLTGKKAGDVIGTGRQWSAFYGSKRPVMADLIVDGANEEEVRKHYKGRCRKSALIEGAYEAEGFFKNLGESGKWLSFSAAPLRDMEGNLTGAIETLQDITSVRNAEKELRDSEEKYRKLIESSRDGYAAVNMKGRLTQANSAFRKITGYSEKELFELSFRDLTPKRFHRMEERILKGQVMKRGYSDVYNKEYIRKDGSIVPIEIRTYLLRDQGGRPTGFWAFVRDISEKKKAEERVKQSQERLRSIVEHSRDMFYIHDTKNRLTYVSPQSVELFGYRPAEMRVNWTELVTDNPINRKAREITSKALKTGRRQAPYRIEIKRKDGKKRMVMADESPLRDSEGKVAGIVGALRDITEELRHEDDMRRSLSLIKATMESTDDGILVVDRKGRTSFYNDNFRRMWGIPRKLLRKGNDREMLEHVRSMLSDPEAFLSKVSYLYKHPTKESFDNIRLKDGRVFERYSQPQRLGSKVTGRVWSFRDVTGARKAEQAIRDSEKRLHDILMSSADWIWEVDAKGRYTFASGNVKGILGYSPKEIIGKRPFDFMEKEHAKTVRDAFSRAVRERKPVSDLENWNLTKSGKKVCLLTNGVPIVSEGGKLLGYRGVDKDITLQKKTEQAIKESENRLRSILQSMVDMVFVFDREKRFTYFHAPDEGRLIMKPGDFMGKRPDQVMPRNVSTEFEKAFGKNMAGESSEFEYSLELQGRKRWYSAKMSPIDIDGRFTGSVAVVEDATDKKKAASEIRRRQDELERFNKLAVGRELRMIQLKKRIRELEKQLASGDGNDAKTAVERKPVDQDDANQANETNTKQDSGNDTGINKKAKEEVGSG